jgi:adenylosuccinate synthase
LEEVEVEYEQRPGWQEDLTAARRYEDLPEAARAYVRFLEERLATPIVLISVGPGRDQVIERAEHASAWG